MRPLKISKNAQVMQDLIQCSKDIEYYLQEFSVLGVVYVDNELQKFMGSLTQFSTVPGGVVKVIDPTGMEYIIPLDFCHSYEQFDKVLLALFEGEAQRMKLLRYFVERGMIDFHFSKGTEDISRDLKKNSWDYVYSGITIQMGFILQGCMGPSGRFKCPRCRSCVLDVGEDLSVNCPYCEVHFQICLANEFYPYNYNRIAGGYNPIFRRIDYDFTSEGSIEERDLAIIRYFRFVMVTKEVIIQWTGVDPDPKPVSLFTSFDHCGQIIVHYSFMTVMMTWTFR
ncbi:hypothetical protein CPB84DRAFT_1798565 [Gymnopilus junonius]|uniref:Ubiquitin-like domain-containing protein n=1 Tax=Gymnopilus junonius TaxID=109634 RepID=A0A9P5N883_GYMJU|nr:hypothetical protein CPB84DRAFT_1798565 [Gymnopilus junonius]